MSQHFADCLYGDSIAESDGCCKGVPCHVVGQVLRNLGFFCDLLEGVVACAIIRNLREYQRGVGTVLFKNGDSGFQ